MRWLLFLLTLSVSGSPPAGFNGVILTARDHHSPSVTRSFGFANHETGQAFTERTPSQIGSASKFLTSLVALRLVEQRQLALDAPIATWLPFLADVPAGQVTLRHLLSNTSGIPNGVMDSYRRDPAFTSRDLPAREAAELWGTGDPKFQPGTAWDYSLTNWVVVRAIMESATGKTFETLLQDELIAPLQLRDTGIPGPEFPHSPAAARAYTSLEPPQTRINRLPPYAAASGTIYSSAADLRVIVDGLPAVLSSASLRELTTIQVSAEAYALGCRVIDLAPHKVLWLAGETSSYRAVIAYHLPTGACVIILNNSNHPPASLADTAKSTLRDLLENP